MNAAALAAGRLPTGSGRQRMMVTPEGLALPITIASRGARAVALILDLALVTGLMIGTTLALVAMAGGTASVISGGAGALAGAFEFLFVVWIIAMFLLRNAYFLFFELGPRGATPGKRLAGIRIAARDGGRLTADMVIARNLLRDIELFLPLVFVASAGDGQGGAAGLAATAWFLIFALFPFWNRDRLRAGDIIAGTWVVERPRQRLPAAISAAQPGAPAADLRFTDDELAVDGELEVQALERVLRENRKDALAAVHAAITRKIGRDPKATGDARAFLHAYYTQLRARLESNMRMGNRKADKHS